VLISRIQLKNWRNFREFDVPLREVSYLLGPNASGKSNLLDAFRFLRDISKARGGGLQAAIGERGGISKLRCLNARKDPEVEVDVELAETADGPVKWRYRLGFKSEGKGAQRVLVSREEVWKGKDKLLTRPGPSDEDDLAQRTQTHLEQIQANKDFRDLATFFAETTYLHLVPQLLKFSEKIGGRRLADDPFGQGFLERVATTPDKTRTARLNKINQALSKAVPQFEELRFERDDLGHPHLEALYHHHRPHAGWQSEEHFSDGTLRLIGLLWSLLDGSSMLLLEEPELSLNDAIVKEIPLLIDRLQRSRKVRRQILVSTHSDVMLGNPGIDGRGVVVLEPSPEGTNARTLLPDEAKLLDDGLSIAEVVLPKTHPPKASELSQLKLWP
jgi:predicted ATPase